MRRPSAILVATLLLAAVAFAQMGPPKPAPELKKLDYFLGTWSTGAIDAEVHGSGRQVLHFWER